MQTFILLFSINFKKFIENNKINKSQEIFLGFILTLFFPVTFLKQINLII
ncbi:hypothetical protein BVAVS116_B0019 (plasmid) [Borreliella valaisiana VS116]|uniref:Uncharacterized protein n=1 Tax=Borreliella valaisiana VS116 TaxID=445987 RepID=C0R832_BORVA|nr:hypothetical protein BVAVS116_B0019 [Borreliella valaisiana VS116]